GARDRLRLAAHRRRFARDRWGAFRRGRGSASAASARRHRTSQARTFRARRYGPAVPPSPTLRRRVAALSRAAAECWLEYAAASRPLPVRIRAALRATPWPQTGSLLRSARGVATRSSPCPGPCFRPRFSRFRAASAWPPFGAFSPPFGGTPYEP